MHLGWYTGLCTFDELKPVLLEKVKKLSRKCGRGREEARPALYEAALLSWLHD